MSYRDVSESLRAYRERIANDLDDARRAAKEAAERASKVTILERELAETEALLAKLGGARRGLPLLDDVRIAAPCKADWDGMLGDDHVRFCGQCEKSVYNLSSLSREEAEALLVAKEGKMCVRIFRREDGTVLTGDCPVGVKRRRRRRVAAAAVGGGMMAAAAAMGLESSTSTAMGTAVPATTALTVGGSTVEMGDPAPVVPVPAPTTSTTGQWLGGAIAPIQRQPKATPLMGKPAVVRTK
jgi:hypothetical protein